MSSDFSKEAACISVPEIITGEDGKIEVSYRIADLDDHLLDEAKRTQDPNVYFQFRGCHY
jgi:hypothetical protein